MHVAAKGTSAVGKSALLARVGEFLPPEDVIAFTALSERALLYWKDDFNHKVLAMGEALDGDQQKFQDYLLRELMSEGRLRYPVAQKIDGEIQTTIIEKNGPVAFLITTTKNKLNPENETRMLSLELSDTAEQTALAMQMIAQVRGLDRVRGRCRFRALARFPALVGRGRNAGLHNICARAGQARSAEGGPRSARPRAGARGNQGPCAVAS